MATPITIESEVRSYCRDWPVVFDRATGSRLYDQDGRCYIDFFCGAGALNYGHNNPLLRRAIVEYLSRDGIVHSLDMATAAKQDFLTAFEELILRPRGLDYRVQFPGPAGTNSVEAALKLARKVTGRPMVITFTNAFHGVSLGSLAVTGNSAKRRGAGLPLAHAMPMPYDGYLPDAVDGLRLLDRMLGDAGSGLDLPAAAIVETVQGEGGINVARTEWLQELAALCRRHGMLLIVDDVQMGCGRTGPFFSFEPAGIIPDFVCLAKSIGGYGLPMALTLIRPDLDVWAPGEHNGTFRGNNLAFVAGAAALRTYWSDRTLEESVVAKGHRVAQALGDIAERVPGTQARGRGLVRGLAFDEPRLTAKAQAHAFDHGLLVETSGAQAQVLKLMPSLVIPDEELDEGLRLLADAVYCVAG